MCDENSFTLLAEMMQYLFSERENLAEGGFREEIMHLPPSRETVD